MRYFPTLSEQGWVVSTAQTADFLFAHFFLSDYSQTHLYDGEVASMAWIIQEAQNDDTKLMTLIRSILTGYFSRYFSNVETEVRVTIDPTDATKQNVNIFLSFIGYDDQTYNLSKLLQITDGVAKDVINYSNYGITRD